MLRIRFCVLLILDAITLVITEDTNYASKYEFEKEDDRFDSRREPQGVTMSEEKRLIKKVLGDYKEVGKVGRPVFNTSETVRVSYGLALIQILDLDEKNQVLTTNVWSRYSWTDVLLKWNPAEYGDVRQIRVPVENIWTPDIVLYNYADTRLKEQRDALAVVSHKGEVMWIPPSIFKSTCPIDITHFPFDIQNCTLKFGSWTYDGWKLDLIFYNGIEEVDQSDYIKSNEWRLLEAPAIKHTKYYPCCKEPYPDLTFIIRVKRIAAFYNYILILPCVLLSSLTLVIFWLPPESPAKMILGMNIFVAFFLLLLLLADSTPPAASSVPLIGAYFCLNMVLITLSTFLSVIVINLYFRGDKKSRVPRWLKKFMVDYLGRMLCMRGELIQSEEQGKHDYAIHLDTGKKSDKKRIRCPELKYNKFQVPHPDQPKETTTLRGNCSARPAHNNVTQATVIENDVKEIKRILKSYMSRVHDKDAQNKVIKEWRIVALVLDRMFFFMYLATIIISLGTIFPKG